MKSKTKPKVAIISVNFNNSLMTQEFLKSCELLDVKDVASEIIIVDNGSTEKKSLDLPKKYKNTNFIKSKTNLGFAGGNNLGIKYALEKGADYVLLINNDAQFTDPNTLSKLIKVNKGISAPIVTFSRFGDTIYDYGGRVDKLFGRNTHYESLFTLENDLPKADYYSGVCLLIDSKVFKKIGLLSDEYFLYYEDADFCLRAKKAGFKLKISSEVSIFHNLSSSTNKLGKKKIKILADSHFTFCLKHLPPMSTPFFLAFNVYLRLKSN